MLKEKKEGEEEEKRSRRKKQRNIVIKNKVGINIYLSIIALNVN